MTVSIRFTPDIEQRLDNLAQVTGRTKSFYLREMVERYLEEIEDIYLAADIAEKVKSGKIKTISHEEMRKRLELDN